MAYQDILRILDPTKICSSVQNFIDIYLRLPGIPANGQLTESDSIRVRICEGRFALLIREVCGLKCIQMYLSKDMLYSSLFWKLCANAWPYWLMFLLLHMKPIREGNYIIQPKVDFDISISTVAGLLNLGYVEYLTTEASFYHAIYCSCIPSFPCYIISFAFGW